MYDDERGLGEDYVPDDGRRPERLSTEDLIMKGLNTLPDDSLGVYC